MALFYPNKGPGRQHSDDNDPHLLSRRPVDEAIEIRHVEPGRGFRSGAGVQFGKELNLSLTMVRLQLRAWVKAIALRLTQALSLSLPDFLSLILLLYLCFVFFSHCGYDLNPYFNPEHKF